MFTQIGHIGIAVRSIDESQKIYSGLYDLNQLDQALEWEAQARPLSSLTAEFKERLTAFQTQKTRG